VEDDFAVYAPNSFTPNDDAINDAFAVVTSVQRPELFELRIWDRWGREVFMGNAPEAGWNGSGWPVGIYAWTLRMQDSEGALREARGHVTLLR
jgi:gliding motility-associated-like protein